MRIISIHVGTPRTISYRNQTITTAIFKSQVSGPVMLRTLNLDGDEQGDLKVHGGPNKALYAYSNDAYDAWRKIRPQDSFEPGSLGENLCVDHLPENRLFVGDTLEVGEAIIQVTEPRFPCFKLAAKFNDSLILKHFMKLGRPGIYFKVLREGLIDQNQEMRLISQEKPPLISIQKLFAQKQKLEN